MAPLPTSLVHSSIDNTVGAAFIGLVVSAFLSGGTFLQMYWYFHTYPRDSLLNKLAVGVLWTFDFVHLGLVASGVYHYAITEYGNPSALETIPTTIKLQLALGVVVILLVHSLYAQRVWILGGYLKGVLGYLVATVVAGGFVIGIVLTYVVFNTSTFVELETVNSWAIYSALGTSTGVDFIIAAAMCYYLRRSKGSISRLNSRISRVMQYTLSSGLFTSACSLAAMFSFILLPNTFVFLGLEFLVTKLYISSFLAMLNARERKSVDPTADFSAVSIEGTWKRALKLGTTSSFGSPMPQEMVLPDSLPNSPPKTFTPLPLHSDNRY